MDWLHYLLPWLAIALASYFLLPLFLSSGGARRLPPGPRPVPILGSLLELGTLPHRSLARLSSTYGPLMSLRLGAVTTVVASSPDTAREILQKHDTVLSHRYVNDAARACAHRDNSVVWLPPTSAQFRGIRKAYAGDFFSPNRLNALQPLRQQMVEEMTRYVRQLSEEGVPVDVARVAFATSLNLLSRTFFSVDMAGLNSSSSQEFKDIVVGIMDMVGSPNVSDFFPSLAFLDLQGMRCRLGMLFRKMHRFFDEQIGGRMSDRSAAGMPRKDDFIEVLLDMADQNPGGGLKLDRTALHSLFVDMFSAGSDTSSSTVEWALTELLRRPEAMGKAQEELRTIVGAGREMEEGDISSLPYLRAVVKETLRLHPAAPLLLPRRATEDVEVAGYVIPKGARVFVNAWAIGRYGGAWEEPEEFSPERFLQESEVDFKGRDFELLPFGSGRRMCPGMPLGIRMVHLMLGTLLHRFDWKAADAGGIDMGEKFGVTLSKAVPLRAFASAPPL